MNVKNPAKLFKGLSIAETVLTVLSMTLLSFMFNDSNSIMYNLMDILGNLYYWAIIALLISNVMCYTLIALNSEYGFTKSKHTTFLAVSHLINGIILSPNMIDNPEEIIPVILTVFMVIVRIIYLILIRNINDYESKTEPAPISSGKQLFGKITLWVIGILEFFTVFYLISFIIGVSGYENTVDAFFENLGVDSIVIEFVFRNLAVCLGVGILSLFKLILNGKLRLLPQKAALYAASCGLLWYVAFMLESDSGKALTIAFSVITVLIYASALIYQLIKLIKMSRKGSM